MEYKTFEELKDELGDSFEEYMYKANINLLEQRRKAIEIINNDINYDYGDFEGRIFQNDLLRALEGDK